MKNTMKTYAGKTNRFSDWLKNVHTEADRVGMMDEIRDQITSPMLQEGWRNHETATYFVAKMFEYFGA